MEQELLCGVGACLSTSIFQMEEHGAYGQTGVDASRFGKETLFESNLETAQIIRAEDYGVFSGTKADMRKPLERAVHALKELGDVDKVLTLPRGEIYIYDEPEKKNAYALELHGIKNLTVEGDETQFLLDMTSRGIRVEECENVILRNMSFDRFDLPYFTGTVEKMDVENQYAILKINEEYNPEDNYPVREYLEFNVEDKTPRYHGNFLYNNLEVDTLVESIKSVKLLDEHKAKITFSWELTEAPEGCGFVISKTMYGIDTIAIIQSKNSYFENINIYCTPGMGIRGYSSENIFMNRTNVMLKPDSNRYMTVTADAMHFMDCKGSLNLTNCLMENSHDDSINIHGMFQKVIEVDEEKNRYRLLSARTAKFNESVIGDETTIPFEAGDEIEVSKDISLEYINTVHVASVEMDSEYGFWITLQEKEKFELGVLMGNVTRSPIVLIENCVFRNKRNRGVLLQSRNSIIKNCTFYNVLMPAICIVADCLNWHEGINAKDIRIENNRFVNTNVIKNNFGKLGKGDIDIGVYGKGGTLQAGLIEDLVIKNNAFLSSGGNCISVKSAKNVDISDNLFYKWGTELSGQEPEPVVTENAEEVHMTNNSLVRG